MEDARAVPNRNPANVELRRAGTARHKTVGIVIDGHLAGKCAKRVLKLNQTDRCGVTQADIEEDRQDLLLEESRVELVGKEHGRAKPAPAHPLLKMLREHRMRGHLRHLSPPSARRRRCAESPESTETATSTVARAASAAI